MINDEVTIIGAGVVLEGKLESSGNVRIDGKVKGNINAKGNVTIGENGEVEGEVVGRVVAVGGKITGTVNAGEKVILESKCMMKGDLSYKILEIQAGAKFDGKSMMSSQEKSIRPSTPLPQSETKPK